MLTFIVLRQTCQHGRRSTSLFNYPVTRTFTGSALRFNLSETPDITEGSPVKLRGRPHNTADPTAKATRSKPSKAAKVTKAKSPTKPARLWTPPPKRKISGTSLFLSKKIGGKGVQVKEGQAEWKALSDSERSMYDADAREITVKRRTEYEAWKASLSPQALRQYQKWHRAKHAARMAKREAESGTAGLKRPLGPYVIFCKEYFQKHYKSSEGISPVAVMQASSQAWSNLTLGEKAPYVAQAEELFKAYQQKKVHLMEEKLHKQALSH
ncbi:hypothetical protein FRB98_008148 [Tulasnella sp. 332]|nr:hypothetical protein FRB98_008148 [Tulasnella sp. 332]